MSEPQTQAPPPPPPTTPAPPGKKTSPWVWVLVGCLAILVLIGACFAAGSFFVAKKVKEVAGDVDFEENPVRAAAELAVKLNPELELVESDEEAGTMTVRNKRTGEEATFDYGEMAEGRFGWKTDEGEVTFDAQGGEEGVVTVTGAEGETRWGTGAAAGELPDWVPVYPASTSSESDFTSRSADEVSGMWTLETDASVDEVQAFYQSRLEAAGYEVTLQTMSGPQGASAMVIASHPDSRRQVNVTITQEGSGTKAVLQYSGQP